MKNDYNGRVIL